MSRIGEECKIETWKISRLIDASRREPTGSDIIVIPPYQRRLVWSLEKQSDLIASIKKGYPFGSLLLYENGQRNGKRRHDLIDGLQRTHAIRNYMDNPNEFYKSEDLDADLVNLIVDELPVQGEEPYDIVRKSLVKWVSARKGFMEIDGWGVSELASFLVAEVLRHDIESPEYGTALINIITSNVLKSKLEQFLATVRTEANISDAQLPVILYSGDSSKLPEIFELLNSKGVVLSRYEIYAARWLNYRLTIQKEAIRLAIGRKYSALVDEGFTAAAIDDEDESDSKYGREYTLYEYLFGFGQYLSETFPYLFRPVEADAPSSIGFNLVTACIGIRLNAMENLDDRLRDRNFDLNILGERILECVVSVDGCLKPILSINQRKQPAIYHAELQIVSMIASLFLAKFDPISLTERRDWKKSQKNILEKLSMFYLYDILRSHWRGSGDSKMYDDVSNQRYSRRPPTEDQWSQVLDTWFEESQLTLHHVRRYIREAAPEFLLLKYIYVKEFSVFQNARSYHVEHIIPVNRIVQKLEKNDEGWQINCIANLALLEQEQNLRKGDLTFAEYWESQLKKGKVNQAEYESWMTQDQKKLLCPMNLLPKDLDNLDRDAYERFLLERFFHLRDEFIRLWSELIPSS